MAKILLFTTVTWSCAERIAGALGAADIEALFPQGHAVAASRYLKRAHGYQALTPLRSLRQAIKRAKPDLVVACEDRAARLLAQLYARGEEKDLLERSLGCPGLYPKFYERRAFIAEAAKAGVLAAGMLPAPDEAALCSAVASLGFPLVLKSDASCGGEGVVIAHNKAEARQAWRRLSRKPARWRELGRAIRRRDAHFLAGALRPLAPVVSVQRFIPGRPATSSLMCWRGEVLGANHFDVEISRGDTGPSSVLTRRDCAQMADAGQRIARHFGLSGLIGLDFIRDTNGQVHLLEINPRATPTCHLALGPGHDPCGAMLDILGVAGSPRPQITDARQIALFPQEWRRDPESPWLELAFHDVPRDDPAVVRALLGGSPAGLNDDFGKEFAALLAPRRPKEAWEVDTLTIQQASRRNF
jgi:hypothetical protein